MTASPARRAGLVPRRRLLSLLAVPAVAALAACGGGSTSSTGGTTAASAAASATFPVTVTASNGEVTIPRAPQRIVSLSPTATETLYAIGAGAQVVAVDKNSTHPEEAPRTEMSGFQPNTEAITGYDPDLVVLSNDSNGVMAALTKLGVPVLLEPAATTLEASYEEELQLGQATGHIGEAEALVASVKQRIAAAVASTPDSAKGMKVYHELDQNYYSAASNTFIGSVYTLFGLTNIADKAPKAASSGGYPQLSAEYVVTAAPDVIVLADGNCCGQSPQTVAQRPAFDTVPAVANNRVIVISDDIASRWGPRVADFVEALAKALGGK